MRTAAFRPSGKGQRIARIMLVACLWNVPATVQGQGQGQGNNPSSGAPPANGEAEVVVETALRFGRYLSRIPPGGAGEITLAPNGSVDTTQLRALGHQATAAQVTVRETFPGQGQPVEDQYDVMVSTDPLRNNRDTRTIRFVSLAVRFEEDDTGGSGGAVIERTTAGNGTLSITLEDVDLPDRDQPKNLSIGGTIRLNDADSGDYQGAVLIEALRHHQ